ncbi:MAG TPA: formylglycine-generating enzyme family protein, partial [Nitrosomonas sp.]|nr:formylglycine-generating enzyme family protein [Nitrosomonas sp.]
SSLNWQNPGFSQDDHHPVVCISWQDTQHYLAWLSQRTEVRYRLPSEAEWEYAARARTITPYFYQPDQQCTYANGAGQETKAIAASNWMLAQCTDSFVYTAPVASFIENPFGLFDMAGNVWEWTQDCWHDNYTEAPTNGSAWLDQNDGDCSRQVLRSGSWNFNPQNLRSAIRFRLSPDDTFNINGNIGFRVARDF